MSPLSDVTTLRIHRTGGERRRWRRRRRSVTAPSAMNCGSVCWRPCSFASCGIWSRCNSPPDSRRHRGLPRTSLLRGRKLRPRARAVASRPALRLRPVLATAAAEARPRRSRDHRDFSRRREDGRRSSWPCSLSSTAGCSAPKTRSEPWATSAWPMVRRCTAWCPSRPNRSMFSRSYLATPGIAQSTAAEWCMCSARGFHPRRDWCAASARFWSVPSWRTTAKRGAYPSCARSRLLTRRVRSPLECPLTEARHGWAARRFGT
mmetsp:Transcript_103012/g.330398  ORF Transcript_103012/g.330398 Transcript_103012/m.330398 type:complete len:262 (-) Transcript_103012:226-1011(-)